MILFGVDEAPARCSVSSASGRSGIGAKSVLPRRGSRCGAAHDHVAPVEGEEKRAAGHQEEASAVREPKERHAGELHPAQVSAFPPRFRFRFSTVNMEEVEIKALKVPELP